MTLLMQLTFFLQIYSIYLKSGAGAGVGWKNRLRLQPKTPAPATLGLTKLHSAMLNEHKDQFTVPYLINKISFKTTLEMTPGHMVSVNNNSV